MNKSIKVVIVDDHTMVRDGLKKMLTTEADIEVIGEAGNGKEAVKVVGKLGPDVVVLDISMPEMGGLEAIPLLREVSLKTKIVILSMHGKETLAREALQQGASAYILKGDCGEELINAIRAAHRGEFYFSSQLRSVMVTSFVGGKSPNVVSKDANYQLLTDREKQFFHLMMMGHSTNKISEVMHISPKTGQKHQTNIFKKLGMSSQVKLLKYAIRIGIVDPDSFDES